MLSKTSEIIIMKKTKLISKTLVLRVRTMKRVGLLKMRKVLYEIERPHTINHKIKLSRLKITISKFVNISLYSY